MAFPTCPNWHRSPDRPLTPLVDGLETVSLPEHMLQYGAPATQHVPPSRGVGGSNPTPSASMLFSLVRHCSEDSIKSTRYLAECIYLFTGVRQN
jgi:hypothetical protein